MKRRIREVSALVILAGAIAGASALAVLQPLDDLAAPSPVCQMEVGAMATVFLLSIPLSRPVADLLNERAPRTYGLLRTRVRLPRAIRALALLVVFIGSFVFAFWATADVLGGYNGYGWSFSAHPFLGSIYGAVGLRYISSWDAGNQAAFFFLAAVAGIVVYRMDHGVGAALKDAVTLFAAPLLILFELALWYYAPEDMSWHVTDLLSVGGVADGGWRVVGGGGSYLVSNWLVFFTSLFLVASRLPWLGLSSRVRGHRGQSASARLPRRTAQVTKHHIGQAAARAPAPKLTTLERG